ncbi:MAG: PPOX class F420-dependent oxidoreductase [Candidatus Bathyarchaeia archaeon]
MAITLTERTVKLIDGKNFAFLATLQPDGSPHVTPMWIDHEGDMILMNTAMGRIKQRNVTRDPRVSIAIVDSNNPYDRIVMHGRVVSQTEQGAEAHIDKLAKKYTGANKYQKASPTEKRIILKIEPLQIL